MMMNLKSVFWASPVDRFFLESEEVELELPLEENTWFKMLLMFGAAEALNAIADKIAIATILFFFITSFLIRLFV